MLSVIMPQSSERIKKIKDCEMFVFAPEEDISVNEKTCFSSQCHGDLRNYLQSQRVKQLCLLLVELAVNMELFLY